MINAKTCGISNTNDNNNDMKIYVSFD